MVESQVSESIKFQFGMKEIPDLQPKKKKINRENLTIFQKNTELYGFILTIEFFNVKLF